MIPHRCHCVQSRIWLCCPRVDVLSHVSVDAPRGFAEAVSVAATELPPSTLALPVAIPKEAKAGLLSVLCWQDAGARDLYIRFARNGRLSV